MEVDREWPPTSAQWTVRMLGRLEVVSKNGDRPKFRSKSCLALLAYLALNPGKEVSRFLLEETFWPQSDGDRQAQNLRRAVSDLRDALGGEHDRGSLIVTQRDVVSTNQALVVSDAIRFLELTSSGLNSSNDDLLHEAFTLYGGPLLSPLSEDWAYGYRLEYEERYGQCVETLCRIRVDKGVPKEAVRIARAAVLAAPTREDIHIALIGAYRSSGLEAEAIRQFEDLERMMDENWGEPPSQAAKDALDGKIAPQRTPTVNPTSGAPNGHLERTGGAMAPSSPYYIRRNADAVAESCLDQRESVILVQGPRQVGKSSLLARAMAYAREHGYATVLNDFQTIGESQLADEERLYRTLAHSLASQLDATIDLETNWTSWLGPNMNLDAILGKLLVQVDRPVCWAIDEADRLFGRPYASDFFGLLRSWHNRRALDPNGPWSRFSLVIAYATEAHLFITDINQSPFNVGVRIPVRDFGASEIDDLAARFGIDSKEAIETVRQVANGHPFLTRKAIAFLAQGGSPADLQAQSSTLDGPFGDHLQWVLATIQQDPEVAEEVARMIAGERFAKPTTRFRLMASGLIAMSPDTLPEFRVPAYRPFLAEALG